MAVDVVPLIARRSSLTNLVRDAIPIAVRRLSNAQSQVTAGVGMSNKHVLQWAKRDMFRSRSCSAIIASGGNLPVNLDSFLGGPSPALLFLPPNLLR